MNFTIAKSLFYEALHKIIGVIPQKTTMSILSCILMDLRNGILHLTGTDLEISISTSIPVDSSDEGIVAVPAKFLSEIVRELPDVPLNIYSDSASRIILNTEKGEYKISTQDKEDYPKINIEDSQFEFQLNGKTLKRIIEKTSFAVSTDELRPALTGINMEIFTNELRFVATDGHRLVRIIAKDFSADESMQRSMIIPTKTFSLLLRNLKDEDKVTISTGEDHIVFTSQDAIVYSKLINASYPNYERVIPTDNSILLQVNRENLISALRRVSIFSNSLTHQIRLILTPNEMTIQSEDIEFGAEAKEVIPASLNTDWLQIGYNSNYIIDVLRHLDSSEIVFMLKDSNSAAILHSREQMENEDLIMLLMPIRINEENAEPAEEVDDDSEVYVE